MVYNPRDHEWMPNTTDNLWVNYPEKNLEYEYYVIHTIGWSLQPTNITLSFDLKSENIFYGKTRTKCNLERDYCPPNHAIKATIIWKPNDDCVVLRYIIFTYD